MTDQEILQKAVSKAFPHGATGKVGALIMSLYEFKQDEFQTYALEIAIIFNHSFAKAFFGEEDVLRIGLNKEQYIATWIEDHRKTYTLDEKKNIASQDWEYFKRQGNVKPVWMFHLQEMVISDNPILYLEAYL